MNVKLRCWLMEKVFSVERKMIEEHIAALEKCRADAPKTFGTGRGLVQKQLLGKLDEVRKGLNVKDDHPVLRSVLTLMDAKQQAHVEAAGSAGIAADEAKAEARCVVALQEMQEIILEEADKARVQWR